MKVPFTRILAAGGLVLLAACSGTPTAGNPPSVPTIGSSAPSAPSSPSVSDTTSSATPETPAEQGTDSPPPQQANGGPGECKAADLSLSIGDSEGAAGTVYRKIVFTNKSGRTCTIQGFPGVSYVTGDDGHQVGEAAVRVGTKGPVITLAPGAKADAPVGFVQVGNFDPGACQPTPTRGLRIYPPHDTASMFLPLDGTGCAGKPPGQQLSVRSIEKI
ncbi:DUF4232 domain-containing protein [Kibdelosporangium lantanae]